MPPIAGDKIKLKSLNFVEFYKGHKFLLLDLVCSLIERIEHILDYVNLRKV